MFDLPGVEFKFEISIEKCYDSSVNLMITLYITGIVLFVLKENAIIIIV